MMRMHGALLRDGTIIRTKSWDEPIPRDHQ
jgi:hypothetical protein